MRPEDMRYSGIDLKTMDRIKNGETSLMKLADEYKQKFIKIYRSEELSELGKQTEYVRLIRTTPTLIFMEIRDWYISTNSWAIPDLESLTSIVEFFGSTKVVSIGSGLALWERLLSIMAL